MINFQVHFNIQGDDAKRHIKNDGNERITRDKGRSKEEKIMKKKPKVEEKKRKASKRDKNKKPK